MQDHEDNVAGQPQGESPAGMQVQSPVASPGPDQAQATDAAVADALRRMIRSCGSWLYWIAALSIINTFAAMFSSEWALAVGLGVTQIFDSAISEFGKGAAIFVLPINLMIAGVYVLFGYFACKGAKWAFITSLILYGLDTLLFLVPPIAFVGLAIHAYALFCLSKGLSAVGNMQKLEEETRRQAYLSGRG